MKDAGDNAGSTLDGCQLRVGCALLAKKVARYLTPCMLQTAAANGIKLIQIDLTRSLLEQGPFNVIIHKLRPNADWERMLQEYKAANPEVCIIDSLDRIRALHNRATMLTPLQGNGITLQQPQDPQPRQHHQQQPQQQQTPTPQQVRVQAPLQVEIPEGATEAEAQAALTSAGLSPPLLCKPLWTDGREGSHGLAVLHDLEALGRLMRGAVSSEFKPPLVVQQFVEHGGVLFKVYVLGSQTVVTARPSLGETVLEAEQGVQQLPRISCVSVFGKQHLQQQQQQPVLAAAAASWTPPAPATALCPPDWLTAALAATLRQELGMQLFNFDLIVPEQQQQQQQQQQQVEGSQSSESSDQQQPALQQAPPLCYVVDINYFPGVDKIPDFEQRFVAFLKAAAAEGGCAAAVEHQHQQQQQQGMLQQQLQQQQVEVLNLVQQQQAHVQLEKPVLQVPNSAAWAAAATPAAVAVACRQMRHSWSNGSTCSSSSSSSGRFAGGPLGCSPVVAGNNNSSNNSSSSLAGASRTSSNGCESFTKHQQQQQQHSLLLQQRRQHTHHHPHSHSGVLVGGLDAAGVGVLGSSPPQLQVAGCS